MPISYADTGEDPKVGVGASRSYKDSVLGITDDAGKHVAMETSSPTNDVSNDEAGKQNEYEGACNRLSVVEKMYGKDECPEIVIVLSAWEEEHICKPWNQGLIVKLLGRKKGFKALENRLNQSWVKSGVLFMIDIGNDFFLIYLSSAKDLSLLCF